MKLFIKKQYWQTTPFENTSLKFQAVTNTLSPLRHAHPGAYLGGSIVPCPLLCYFILYCALGIRT